MEDKLNLIITQNWIMLAILVFLLISTVACNITNLRREKRTDKDPQFGNLWETDQIDKLLEETDRILDAYPNRVDAIYFRAKALRKIGKHENALHYFERLKDIDPSFRKEAIRQIEDIQELTANK